MHPLAKPLQNGLSEMDVAVTPAQQAALLAYVDLLHKWNKTYNLTAVRDPKEMVVHHLLDSLVVLPHLWPGRWLDVGCGAGLPGLVLAVMRPDWSITLLDSNSKKTSFVQHAIIHLGLRNAQVRCSRVEDFQLAQRFDGIISRAFTELGDFLRCTRHLLADDGRWAAMKGRAETELSSMPDDCRVDKILPLHVPGLNAARSLVLASPHC